MRVAFPLFIHDAVSWLAGRDGAVDTAAAGLRAGETVRLAAGETLWTRPQRSYQPVNDVPAAERLVGPGIFQPMHDGFYLRRGADGADAWLAVNTGDREMSAVNAPSSSARSAAAAGMAAPVAAGSAWEAMRVWPPWVYLALMGFVLCALEWWGFHRRRTE